MTMCLLRALRRDRDIIYRLSIGSIKLFVVNLAFALRSPFCRHFPSCALSMLLFLLSTIVIYDIGSYYCPQLTFHSNPKTPVWASLASCSLNSFLNFFVSFPLCSPCYPNYPFFFVTTLENRIFFFKKIVNTIIYWKFEITLSHGLCRSVILVLFCVAS